MELAGIATKKDDIVFGLGHNHMLLFDKVYLIWIFGIPIV